MKELYPFIKSKAHRGFMKDLHDGAKKSSSFADLR